MYKVKNTSPNTTIAIRTSQNLEQIFGYVTDFNLINQAIGRSYFHTKKGRRYIHDVIMHKMYPNNPKQ